MKPPTGRKTLLLLFGDGGMPDSFGFGGGGNVPGQALPESPQRFEPPRLFEWTSYGVIGIVYYTAEDLEAFADDGGEEQEP